MPATGRAMGWGLPVLASQCLCRGFMPATFALGHRAEATGSIGTKKLDSRLRGAKLSHMCKRAMRFASFCTARSSTETPMARHLLRKRAKGFEPSTSSLGSCFCLGKFSRDGGLNRPERRIRGQSADGADQTQERPKTVFGAHLSHVVSHVRQ